MKDIGNSRIRTSNQMLDELGWGLGEVLPGAEFINTMGALGA